jgi:hypothetical protein
MLSQHTSSIVRSLVACGLGVIVATSCRNSPGTDPPPTSALTTMPASSSLPPATTTTTVAIPNTAGTDLVVVMQNLSLLLNLASERVDLSLLDVIYTPDAAQRATLEKQLRYLLDNGWHYDDSERSKVSDITVQTPLAGVAVIDLISSQGTQVLKDASGKVVKTGEGWSPRRERYGLFRGDDGRWRIRDASLLGPA